MSLKLIKSNRCSSEHLQRHWQQKSITMAFFLVTPSCRIPETKIYGISTTEILNVTCDFEADPRDTQIQWTLNNSQGFTVLSHWTNGGPRSVFRYSPKTEDGYGILMCRAKNSIGIQKSPCIIKVVPAGKI